MKKIALTVLHYGKPYLAYAMQSLIEHVDEYWILYSPTPSHNGATSALRPPDTEDELRSISATVAGSKLRWHKDIWRYEGQQRDAIHALCPDADVIYIADYDEIWLPSAIEAVQQELEVTQAGSIRIPLIHFWRSFHRAVIDDKASPTRVLMPKAARQNWYINLDFPNVLAHFGYAIPANYMTYKWSGIHGHQNELRQGWLKDTFLANSQSDCHPVTVNYWNPVEVDPWQYLPDFMQSHPYAKLEVIP